MAEFVIGSRLRNPFASRWVRPGVVPYLFSGGEESLSLVARLRENGWRGAIAGPHGSGKSTLLASLMPVLEEGGVGVRCIALHDGERCLPVEFLSGLSEFPAGLVMVDGYEQLGWWGRRRLQSRCDRYGWGLLVTAHDERSLKGLPILYRTIVNLTMVQDVVENYLPTHGGLISRSDVAAAFSSQRGNVRDTLFALYHLFEKRAVARRLASGDPPPMTLPAI